MRKDVSAVPAHLQRESSLPGQGRTVAGLCASPEPFPCCDLLFNDSAVQSAKGTLYVSFCCVAGDWVLCQICRGVAGGPHLCIVRLMAEDFRSHVPVAASLACQLVPADTGVNLIDDLCNMAQCPQASA